MVSGLNGSVSAVFARHTAKPDQSTPALVPDMAAACLSSTDRMVRISKEMSFLLRHKPPPGL